MKNNLTLLGGLSVKEFLRDYWQKKPLLIRQAIPGFSGLLSPKQLITLSCNPDAQSRLVTYSQKRWELHHGPFKTSDFSKLSKTQWSVLVQGVNHSLPQAEELLKRFNFIPHSRLDDLMVSYAPKAGGVGPHFDSYDVFLLQGSGHRRWQISEQLDQTLVEGAPLRILKHFKKEQEWVLAPGDMLYLPPHCAHNGIAEDDCMTYSIGFRTPSYQELGEQFLIHLQDNLCLDGMYADPDLKTQTHPSEISAQMLRQVEKAIKQIKWETSDVASFLGRYLSEPKSHIFFDPPEKSLSLTGFQKVLKSNGIKLNLKTQMLCHQQSVFINGDEHTVDNESLPVLRTLADNRRLGATSNITEDALRLIFQWYTDGYLAPVLTTKQMHLE
jgi:50S ribosomal protein L16 3-hydroxylase